MSKHSLVKAGACVGLMAASLGAGAVDLHSFAEPMIYYKVSGAAVNYIAFVPSSLGTGVLMLDLYQSGTVSTWAYAAGAVTDSSAGGIKWSVGLSRGAATNDFTFAGASVDPLGTSTTVTVGNATLAASTTVFSSTWYGGDTSSISAQFTQAQTISSQVCNVSFAASIGTDDYLVFNGFSMRPDSNYPSGWSVASDSPKVTWRTASGTTASDTSTMSATAWNAVNFSATMAFPTFSAFTVQTGSATGNTATYAASVLSKANLCVGAYTAKAALNAAGGFIGAKAGLMRLW